MNPIEHAFDLVVVASAPQDESMSPLRRTLGVLFPSMTAALVVAAPASADPDVTITFVRHAESKPLPNTGRVVVRGNPHDGWHLVEWDGAGVE
jgi:hypothetical protein